MSKKRKVLKKTEEKFGKKTEEIRGKNVQYKKHGKNPSGIWNQLSQKKKTKANRVVRKHLWVCEYV